MTCRDVSFARARCRIELETRTDDRAFTATVAHVYVIENDGRRMRPLAFADGGGIEIHGESEALALNSAMTYLEQHFGGLAEPDFACDPAQPRPEVAEPFVIEPAPSAPGPR